MTKISWKPLVCLFVPMLMSCETTSPQTPTPSPGPVVSPTPTPTPLPDPTPPQSVGSFRTSGNVILDLWRQDFANRALQNDYSTSTIRSVLDGIKPMSIFLEQRIDIQDQAEFSKPIWQYVDDTVSASRLSTGKGKLQTDATLFAALEAEYGVPKEYLAAIWGMETSFGGYMGDFDAPSALASMAAEGRRKSFAEAELYALMKILDRGDARREWLKAGWAGAMGHTQFMPSTFYAYAVDWTGDGTKDVWRARADALASAGNYLRASGWKAGQPALREVRLPAGFDYALASGIRRSIASWQSLNLVPVAHSALAPPDIELAELWLPAGHTGPAFLLFENFNVIKTYNRADSYALAVALMAESFNGPRVPAADWPRTIDLLSIDEVRRLQTALNQLGHNAGPVDGIAGRGTRTALQRFQAERGLLADGFPTRSALDAVMAAG